MSEKEKCVQLIDAVPEYKLGYLLAFIQGLTADEDPNAETLEAVQEVRRMKDDPGAGRTYADVDTMMKELLA